MRRMYLLLCTTLFISACATDGRFRSIDIPSGPCGAVNGFTFTGIVYGDSKLVVVPVSRIRAGTEWRFYLRPIIRQGSDPDDYGAVDVTIKGKFPADPPPPPNRNDWIDVSGTYNGSGPDHYITVCVPATALPGQKFQYMVDVDKVGELDPRADVW